MSGFNLAWLTVRGEFYFISFTFPANAGMDMQSVSQSVLVVGWVLCECNSGCEVVRLA